MDRAMSHFSADSISMRFDHRRVLADVYLEADKGDVIGILGPNGSGKSTLYKCLLGLFRASTGSVRIDGRYVSRRESLGHFAYLPQSSFLPLDMRLGRSVGLILGKRGDHSLFEGDPRASSLLREKRRRLSTGEIRYVECLLVLSLKRSIVLLDEPFSQIEPIYCETLTAYIRNSAPSKVTFLSDHLYGNIQKASTQIKVLADGTLWSVENSRESLVKHGYLSDSEAL
jgi:lipopolysaccharide export system ATP-binding protein